jgi:drug/metabolite transporter (DMT)-like permease
VKNWIISDALNGLLLYIPNKINEKSKDFKAFFALGIVSLVWGTTWVVSRQGVTGMPALEMAGIRQILGGLCYLTYFYVKKFPLPSPSQYIPLVVLAFLNFFLSNGLSTWGVKYISSGLAAIIGAIFPIWIVVIGLCIEKNLPPRMAIIGLITGFGGICIIFYNHLSSFIQPDFSFGILVSLIATISWAFGTIYTKKHAKIFNAYFGLGFQMLLSGIVLLVVSSLDASFMPFSEIPKVSWYAIFYLVIFGSVIGFGCYLYALQRLPTEVTATYAYINPIVALIAGWFLLHESINLFTITGCLITISGIYIINKSYKGY